MAGDGSGRRRVGPVERAVRADLRKLPKPAKGERLFGMAATLREAALTLAKAIDALGTTNASTLGKLVDSLRVTMGQLTKVGEDDGDGEQAAFAAEMASPVRDGEES